MKKGIFITFEGPEGGGKSTQIQYLADALRSQGHPVVLTREPGGTRLAKVLRKLLLHTNNVPLSPLAELLLYEADRAQHVEECILPGLKRRQVVLCDRYFDSTTAYQGYGRGLPLSLIHTLNRIASRGRKPDLTILLDVSVRRGLRLAAASKNGKDRLEAAGMAFHRRVRRGFLRLAAKEPRRFRIVKQRKNPMETQWRIQQAVGEYLKKSFSLKRRRWP